MIDKSKIYKAALAYCAKCLEISNKPIDIDNDNCVDLYNGYISGYRDAIKQFLNTLWYAASEEPKRGKDIIAISKKEQVYTFHYHALSAIRKSFHDCNIERWCYLSDILPKGGGEG